MEDSPPKVQLRPYQAKALAAILDAFKKGVHRQLVLMATGLGKTVLVAALAAKSRRGDGYRFFGMMHREELIQQAAEKLSEQSPDRKVDFEKGKHRAAADADIVLASVPTVARERGKRLEKFSPDSFSKIWIDEVHHAPAQSYITVLEHFGLHDNPGTSKLLIGTTATPERLDRLGYDKLFDDVVYKYDLREAIEDGWLAELVGYRVVTGTDLSDVRTRSSRGDFIEKDLDRVVNIRSRNKLAVETYLEHARGRRNLVFCVTKDHARNVAELFIEAGVKANVVVEDTPPSERRQIIKDFRNGALDVLVNVSVLTEGFDVPEVGAVHLLRPTRSRSLYLQMLGRGTRRIPGKDDCLVFDYADLTDREDLAEVGTIFGLPPGFNFLGNGVLGTVRDVEDIESDLDGIPLASYSSLEDLHAQLERCDPLKLYATFTDETLDDSYLAWHRMKEDHYAVSWRNPDLKEFDRLRATAATQGWQLATIEAKGLCGLRERVHVQVNLLGAWDVVLEVTSTNRSKSNQKLFIAESRSTALRKAEAWVTTERPHVVRLLDRRAGWMLRPASEAQVRVLLDRGYRPEELYDTRGNTRITKGEASVLFEKPVPRFLRRKG